MRKDPKTLRSYRWLGEDDLRSSSHRSRFMQMGYAEEDWQGRPMIAIINTWSDINQCHSHFKHRIDDIKRGVLQAGGMPLELPAISLSEPVVKPSTMLYRNFLAMETEELLRSHPIDGAVLMGGRGHWKGKTLGSGSDSWKYWDDLRAGEIDRQDWNEVMGGIARSYGTCMTMGTAATMMSIADSIGMCLNGASSIPAADSNHIRMCSTSGRRIVEMVWDDLKPSDILTADAYQNGVSAAMAMGCSTNAIIHLIAMARRSGVDLSLADFEKKSRSIPVIANIRPSGDTYLMEDFFYAGGLPAMLSRIESDLHTDCITVSGKTWAQALERAEVYNDDVIRTTDNPIYAEGALAVLHGSLAPDGCVIKPSACEPRLLQHSGSALVFDNYADMKAIIDDDDLDVDQNTVLVLRNAGPKGGPGMPEWGMLPIPKKLLKQGVRDMLRISDARMSGTSYGACILHVAPESYVGGPLALVKTGDIIEVDVPARTINLKVDAAELKRRQDAWQVPSPRYERGYGWMFSNHILQADSGCDFDFLETSHGKPVDEPSIF